MPDLRYIQQGIGRRSRRAWVRTTHKVLGRSHGFVNPRPELAGVAGTTTLDLGCGARPRNPFEAESVFGVDVVDFGDERIRVADLAIEPIPFDDDSFDYVTAYDFLEHVPRLIYVDGARRSPFIEVLNEVHRVLRPGGIFHAHTPAFPRAEAFMDPTHVNIITEGTVHYFTTAGRTEIASTYGFTGNFDLVDQYWDEAAPYHLVWQLRAV